MTFKDRVANKPNRIKITYEDGGNSVYATVDLADDPVEAGTPLNALNMNKLLNKEDTDYITEQGTSGIWTYRKWASGVAECWGSLKTSTILNKPWDTTGFFITEAFPVDTIYFPITFTEKPSVVAAADSDYSVFLINAGTKHTPTTLGTYHLVRPGALDANLTYQISLTVKGRWK